MEMKLLRPIDGILADIEPEEVTRLKDRREFNNNAEWAVYQAKVFYEGFGDTEKAIEILEDARKAEPGNSDLIFCLAECYSRSEEGLDQAFKLCEKGVKIDNKSDYGYTIMARVQVAQQKPIDAYTSAMNALKINNSNYEAGIYLGSIGFAIAMAEGDIEEMQYSLENLRLTKKIFPDSARLDTIIKENEDYLKRFKQGG